MTLFITPAEVVELAFASAEQIRDEFIKESKIVVAQRKFLKPIFGKSFYAALQAGEYANFVQRWLKPALAYYVRYAVLPDLYGVLGHFENAAYSGKLLRAEGTEECARLRRQALEDASQLIQEALVEVRRAPEFYPEYLEAENVRNYIRIQGNLVLPQ